jgi:hypothetical protein
VQGCGQHESPRAAELQLLVSHASRSPTQTPRWQPQLQPCAALIHRGRGCPVQTAIPWGLRRVPPHGWAAGGRRVRNGSARTALGPNQPGGRLPCGCTATTSGSGAYPTCTSEPHHQPTAPTCLVCGQAPTTHQPRHGAYRCEYVRRMLPVSAQLPKA